MKSRFQPDVLKKVIRGIKWILCGPEHWSVFIFWRLLLQCQPVNSDEMSHFVPSHKPLLLSYVPSHTDDWHGLSWTRQWAIYEPSDGLMSRLSGTWGRCCLRNIWAARWSQPILERKQVWFLFFFFFFVSQSLYFQGAGTVKMKCYNNLQLIFKRDIWLFPEILLALAK